MTRPFYEAIRWYVAICNSAYFLNIVSRKYLTISRSQFFRSTTISYSYVTCEYSSLNSRKNVFIRTKIPFPFRAIRYFSSFFMTNIIRFLQATRDFLKIHICDQTNFLSATLNGWNIVIHTTLLMVLLYIVLYKKHTKSANLEIYFYLGIYLK